MRVMSRRQAFQQSIYIAAPVPIVDHCITDQPLMHRWLNPALRCQPIGTWSSEVGSRSRFMIQIPLLQPALESTVIERELGRVVWAFQGFFTGCDRWECQPEDSGTRLLNRFEFEISNPWIAFGFNTLAAGWTRQDMQAQLRRLKQVAEEYAAQGAAPQG